MEEKLWKAGRAFFREGSPELKAWVEAHLGLLYQGHSDQMLENLKRQRDQIARTAPGTKGRRQTLDSVIQYLERRRDMIRYADWQAQDLVLASGQVEGAARHVVGLRLDGPGMRWIVGRAEPLLHLRSIAINGDWNSFVAWTYARYHRWLRAHRAAQIRTNQPLPLKLAA